MKTCFSSFVISRSIHCHPCSLPLVTLAPFSLIPAPSIVIPTPFPCHPHSFSLSPPLLFLVTPAEAGAQGPMQHIAGFTAFPVARSCRLPWAPVFTGVTREGAGVRGKKGRDDGKGEQG